MTKIDTIIIGAGAAGLMCAIEVAKRNKHVLIIESANKPGKKILMSGGGRCNFTNLNTTPENYISHNQHFVKSALSRYKPRDFIELVEKYKIKYHEKTLGQLFCNDKSKQILNMLLDECNKYGAKINSNETISQIKKTESGFNLKTQNAEYYCESLVIACGGLSIPTLGASPFGYKIAEQFDLKVWPTRAGLVPFTLHNSDKVRFHELAGVSNYCEVTYKNISFKENILFTHRGLSGPAILQISSYWQPGDEIIIDLLPGKNICEIISKTKITQENILLKTLLGNIFAKSLVSALFDQNLLTRKLKSLNNKDLNIIKNTIHTFKIKPNGTEGYRTAEVTLGGVDCNEVSSKTMQSNKVPGLYFIGEVLDVSGWLGGYNFQWAWSSGWAAGQAI
jgi:predicted Rossmann fold flavoprotein